MKNNERIAKVIAQGKWRFILVRGVLVFGLVSATLAATLTYFFKSDASTSDVVRPFVIFPLAGVLWGALMWAYLKRKLETSENGNA